MIPPLPPPMPPWPGGKPPWERAGAGQTGSEAQQPQQQAAQPQMQQAAPPLRPQVLHGLVPPQMVQPTYPMWVMPQPYFRPAPPARPAQQPPRPQPAPPQQQAAQQPQATGPMKVERAEETTSNPQQFRPVLPVSMPGLPLGARHRDYWTRS